MDKSFKLEIITPEREFFNDECESLTVTSAHGEMGVLADSLPMAANLADGVTRIRQKNKWMRAYTGAGFMHVRPDGVIILAQSAEWPYEIKEKDVEADVNRLNAQLRKQQSLKEYKMAKAQLARQLARLKVKKEM